VTEIDKNKETLNCFNFISQNIQNDAVQNKSQKD